MKQAFSYLFVLFSFAFITNSNAQIALGPKAAMHYYKTAYSDQDDQAEFSSKFRLGYNIGVFVIAPLKDHYSLISEFGFSKKGKKTKVEESGYHNTSNYRFLESSVLLRRSFNAHFIENVKSTWFVNVGPNVQYWMGGNGKIDTTIPVDYKVHFGPVDGSSDAILFVENTNRLLFGLDFGVGVNFQTGKTESVSAELRYTRGHTFLGERGNHQINPDFITYEDSFLTNYRVISIVLAYNFEFNYQDTKKGKSISDKRRKRR
jgi:hypothetical protein